ncbi:MULTISPECIES: SDR family oxidoreductase [unclassified Mesorhizobium]|uniref:SDR family oxidoreductase n=1 Tax=unclassified Mesorhizobium TaxID=325217 RepID=UPI000FCC0E8F|nr:MULTISPECIES: SDR family oxidoreductase [unclassified Mesorhizobium]RUW67221.1 SDR family oxidoreductase [Mesorhizobium sp. M4B.F.Ca.ET.049.02.1.2]RVD30552.1 SDR family oxidoreductase [Mesorhizobium sp. M4B.F.Ca.ET.017.02.2.1]TGV24681.1 SDR family oxidoreductase [Mesorhizobium sp. M4B.F.Ca.ET.143.01.1.1]
MTTAFITGATSGIGRAIAVALSDAGYDVYAVGRSQAALKELQAERPGIVPIAVDVTDREALESVVADLTIDVLINNAGIMPPLGNFADMKIADIDTALEVNVSAAILLTRLVVPQMRERQSGHILFTGSSAGHAAFPKVAVYSATKAAIAGFAAALRADLSQYGIRVTEIVPGRVETQLYKDILDAEARAAMYAGNVAVQPDDVASMVVTLLGLPAWADVTRFDIMPTRPTSPSGSKQGK